MNRRVRVKFCGFTRIEDALTAVDLGVDAIGLVLTRVSSRFIDLDRARALRAALPPLVTSVALFMDDAPDWVAEAVGILTPDLIQFHGSETALACERFGKPYLKAVPMGTLENVSEYLARYPGAAGFVFDSHSTASGGGRGEGFDWGRIPTEVTRPWLLAGGLNAGNVATAIEQVRPYGVDVSSGIESAPGIKDPVLMQRFISEVARASNNILK